MKFRPDKLPTNLFSKQMEKRSWDIRRKFRRKLELVRTILACRSSEKLSHRQCWFLEMKVVVALRVRKKLEVSDLVNDIDIDSELLLHTPIEVADADIR